MATLASLRADGLVLDWEVPLGPRQPRDRVLLLLPLLVPRLEAKLTEGSTWNIEENPAQQLDALTLSFVAGEELCFERQFNSMSYYKDGVWYLKTADVRLFGWFPQKDFFLAASVAIAEEAKRLNLYRPIADEVVRYRNQLALDEPKFIRGNDPHAVVSNFAYPP